jgi:hypothetical protein
MTKEQLAHANAIEKELDQLRYNLECLTTDLPLTTLILEIRFKGNGWEFSNTPSNKNCPEIFKKGLERYLIEIRDRLAVNIKNKITELETEFNNL